MDQLMAKKRNTIDYVAISLLGLYILLTLYAFVISYSTNSSLQNISFIYAVIMPVILILTFFRDAGIAHALTVGWLVFLAYDLIDAGVELKTDLRHIITYTILAILLLVSFVTWWKVYKFRFYLMKKKAQ